MSGIVVMTAVGKAEDAEWIAREIVDRRLAGCVNVLPAVTSVFRWKGEVEKTEEVLLLIKTTRDRFDVLLEALVSMHSYELPEVIAIPIEGGHPPYLAWLEEAGGE